jgi:hypothetical protein
VCFVAGAKAPGAKGSRQKQQQQASHYTSYRISLKPSVAAIRGTSSVPGGSSMAQLRQQQQQYLQESMPAQRSSATLSQLLQHPQLAQQQQQQLWQASGAGNAQQLPGRAFAEQMLQLYNQQGNSAEQGSNQHQQSPQQQPGIVAGSSSPQLPQQQQQQQQHDADGPQFTPPAAAAGLPALQICASPVPPGADSPMSSSSTHQAGLYLNNTGGLDSLSSSMAAGMQGMQGMSHSAAAATARRSLSPGASSASMMPLPGRLPGGMTAAAGQVLASSAASYYNGAGPLTGGAKQGWSTGKYGQGMEAGKCLAEVSLQAVLVGGLHGLNEAERGMRNAERCVH